MARRYIPPPRVTRPTDFTNNCGSLHNIDCESNLAAMSYDSRCNRCVKIKHVINLRRKTAKNGASLQEQASAVAIAEKIVVLFKLTRGEIMDREYAQEVATYKQERVKATRSRAKDRYSDDIFEV
jgi:hypothetical protein